MSNLTSAKHAIQAELNHAKQGMAFYQSRVEALEDALAKIDSVDSETKQGKKAGRSRNGVTVKNGLSNKRAMKASAKPQAKADSDGEKLPSTGKNFWPDLITGQPRSAPEILQAAISALGISPSKGQRKKLAQRQANALSLLTKSGVISSSGAGRERRFFKKH